MTERPPGHRKRIQLQVPRRCSRGVSRLFSTSAPRPFADAPGCGEFPGRSRLTVTVTRACSQIHGRVRRDPGGRKSSTEAVWQCTRPEGMRRRVRWTQCYAGTDGLSQGPKQHRGREGGDETQGDVRLKWKGESRVKTGKGAISARSNP